jgi:undecaprenyl-diphosphatase
MDFGRIIKNFFFLIIVIFSGVTLALITVSVTSGSELSPFNTAVETMVRPFRSGPVTSFMLLVTNIGSPFVLAVLATFLAIYLLLHRDTYDALLYLFSVFFAIVMYVVLKNTFHIERPAESLIADLSGWSYPSGHATVATAFFFATGYSFFNHFKTIRGRAALLFFCIVTPALIAGSRLYLGAHFALDVLAGVALGIFSVSVMVLLFNLFLSEREWWRRRVRHL